MQTTKPIKEVFSDYKTENIIKEAKILELNLIKKMRTNSYEKGL